MLLIFYGRSILYLFSEWIHCRMLHEEGLYIWIYRQCWNCCCHEGQSSPLDRWTLFSSGWRLNFAHSVVPCPCIDCENNFPIIDDQAEKQLNSSWTLMRAGNHGVPTPSEWLADILAPGGVVGIDPVSNCSFAFFEDAFPCLFSKFNLVLIFWISFSML